VDVAQRVARANDAFDIGEHRTFPPRHRIWGRTLSSDPAFVQINVAVRSWSARRGEVRAVVVFEPNTDPLEEDHPLGDVFSAISGSRRAGRRAQTSYYVKWTRRRTAGARRRGRALCEIGISR